MLSVTIGMISIVLMAIGAGALATALVTVNRIQQETVPAVVSMEHIHAWLADADRNAATAYNAREFNAAVSQLTFDAGSAGTNLDLLGRINPDDPQLRFEADVAATSRELQRITDQGTGGPQTTGRLETLAASISYYTSLIGSANSQGSQDLAAGMVYLQAGSNLMHGPGGILSQVTDLRGFFGQNLGGDNLTLEVTAGLLVLYTGTALALLVLLVHTQRYVRNRFRRRRNSRLLAATLLVLVLVGGGGTGAARAAESIRLAEDQSYTRLQNLWTARSLVYDVNAYATMGLVAQGQPGAFDQTFQSESSQLVDRPVTDQLVRDAQQGQVHFNGVIANELRAADSPEQRDSALHALVAFQQFMQANDNARTQLQAALRAQAAPPRTQSGSKPGQAAAPPSPPQRVSISDDALVSSVDELDWYLGASMQILQRQFDSTMGDAEFTLTVTIGLEILALVIAGLTFWGLQPRIDEYR